MNLVLANFGDSVFVFAMSFKKVQVIIRIPLMDVERVLQPQKGQKNSKYGQLKATKSAQNFKRMSSSYLTMEHLRVLLAVIQKSNQMKKSQNCLKRYNNDRNIVSIVMARLMELKYELKYPACSLGLAQAHFLKLQNNFDWKLLSVAMKRSSQI